LIWTTTQAPNTFYFNSYLAADYTALATTNPLSFVCGAANQPARDAPNVGRLGDLISSPGKSFLDIGIDLTAGHGAVGVPVPTTILTSYLQDLTVDLNTLLTPQNSTYRHAYSNQNITYCWWLYDRFNVTNLKVIIHAACYSTDLDVTTDVLASNANGAKLRHNVINVSQGQSFNDPVITGFKNCDFPRAFQIGIATTDPALDTIVYKVYVDMDNSLV
jgi:hypothetical protein